LTNQVILEEEDLRLPQRDYRFFVEIWIAGGGSPPISVLATAGLVSGMLSRRQ